MGLLDRLGRFIDDVLLLPEDVRADVEAAEGALANELFEEAIGLFEEVLRVRPNLPRALVGLAEAHQALGDLQATFVALAAAREAQPGDQALADWMLRLTLGVLEGSKSPGPSWRDEALQEAARAARTLLGLRMADGGAPFAQACVLSARVEQLRGRTDRAIREYRKALAASPDAEGGRYALASLLFEAGKHRQAVALIRTMEPSQLSSTQAANLGELLFERGENELSASWLRAAIDAGSAPARGVEIRRLLRLGAVDDALAQARAYVAAGGGGEALAVLAEVLIARGARREAADAFAASAEATSEQETKVLRWRSALRTAPRDHVGLLKHGATSLAALVPGDPVILAAEGWVALSESRVPGIAAALQAGESQAWLCAAEHAFRAGHARKAIDALEGFEAASDAERRQGAPWANLEAKAAAELRRKALAAVWNAGGEVDLAAAIDEVARLAESLGLEQLGANARRLRDELDRPLMLAFLGEFNAGKSTLINAFIGDAVAPMGIVPTTATLNVLRGGAEKLVRVLHVDGSTRLGDHAQLARLLKEAEAAATPVDRIEIVLPSDTLEKVWIVDAPGTNALDPEHERLAHEAARRADAVLWVFNAAQAGKLTENHAVATLRGAGRLVVPVLNKVDRLKEGELPRVQDVVSAGFGTPGFALSAKAALKASIAGDDAAYEQSGFPELLAHLEAEVFGRSRELKHSACAGRLAVILDQALAEGEGSAKALLEESQSLREGASRGAPELYDGLILAVGDALRNLHRDREQALGEAAREVVAFARIRRGIFADGQVAPEDQAFLRDTLEGRLSEAMSKCERRLRARVRGLLAQHELSADAAGLSEAVAMPIATYWGQIRGELRAGILPRFFARLSRLEGAGAIAAALAEGSSDPDRELRGPLLDALERLVERKLQQRRARSGELLEAQRRLLRERVLPLRALSEVLTEARR